MKLTKETLSKLSHKQLVAIILATEREVEAHASRLQKSSEASQRLQPEGNNYTAVAFFHTALGLERANEWLNDTVATALELSE